MYLFFVMHSVRAYGYVVIACARDFNYDTLEFTFLAVNVLIYFYCICSQ
jgi:hypothetical protein